MRRLMLTLILAGVTSLLIFGLAFSQGEDTTGVADTLRGEGATEQDTTEQDTTEQVTAEEDTTKREMTEQDTTTQETTEQDTTKADTTVQDTTKQEMTEEDTTRQETAAQDTMKQETVEQDTTKQVTTEEDTTRQETAAQDTTKQETVEQDTTKQVTTEQDTTKRELTEQDTTAQDTTAQDTTAHDTTKQEPIGVVPKYIGNTKCRQCHNSTKKGKLHDLWAGTKHATAYATLASDESKEIAEQKGITDAQGDEGCLKCHVSGYGEPVGDEYSVEEGVGCEACHGPGERYWPLKVMKEEKLAEVNGLVKPDEKVCAKCHNDESPTYKEFEFKEAYKLIEHHTPKAEKK
jgi:hypothetical protein